LLISIHFEQNGSINKMVQRRFYLHTHYRNFIVASVCVGGGGGGKVPANFLLRHI